MLKKILPAVIAAVFAANALAKPQDAYLAHTTTIRAKKATAKPIDKYRVHHALPFPGYDLCVQKKDIECIRGLMAKIDSDSIDSFCGHKAYADIGRGTGDLVTPPFSTIFCTEEEYIDGNLEEMLDMLRWVWPYKETFHEIEQIYDLPSGTLAATSSETSYPDSVETVIEEVVGPYKLSKLDARIYGLRTDDKLISEIDRIQFDIKNAGNGLKMLKDIPDFLMEMIREQSQKFGKNIQNRDELRNMFEQDIKQGKSRLERLDYSRDERFDLERIAMIAEKDGRAYSTGHLVSNRETTSAGIFQLTEDAARRIGLEPTRTSEDERFDIVKSAEAIARYISKEYEKSRDIHAALKDLLGKGNNGMERAPDRISIDLMSKVFYRYHICG
jgi:hypothetical protein